jgi:prepilin-type N-terminal cleavage/methylation domain-containing protein
MVMIPCFRHAGKGFTLIEIIMVIVVLAVLTVVVVPIYSDLNNAAEKASVEYTISSLKTALMISSVNSLAKGLLIVPHNPFDDLTEKPANYAGSFPDVTSSNCRVGEWAFQSGAGVNANLKLAVYNPKATLQKGFPSEGKLFIALKVIETKDSNGKTISLGLADLTQYGGKVHQW